VGRDKSRRPGPPPRLVSIHAPAWGATCYCLRVCYKGGVSIHAPAWGATAAYHRQPSIRPSFNPRARVGRDPGRSVFNLSYEVSIHAPAWGATVLALVQRGQHHGFNPRARVGRDERSGAMDRIRYRFNPRARVGRDCQGLRIPCVRGLFQSTRPRGARPGSLCRRPWHTCFNPRARVGRDFAITSIFSSARGFNPRARVGRDSSRIHSLNS